jgi:hypothetical protein
MRKTKCGFLRDLGKMPFSFGGKEAILLYVRNIVKRKVTEEPWKICLQWA